MSLFLENIRQQAEESNIPIMSKNTEEFICKLLQSQQFLHTLEIGSCIGYSSSIISKAIKPYGGQLTTFEISYPQYQRWLQTIRELWLYNITSYYANFLQIDLDRYLQRKLDFVFIDARKSEYHVYLQKIIPFLNEEYTIVCDDVIKFKNKLERLYTFLKQNQIEYDLHQLDEDDGIIIIQNNAWLLKIKNSA